VTEEQWLACNDPTPMLKFLGDKASDRRLRLFACACCRRTWDLLPVESRTAIGVMERFADGFLEREEFHATGRAVSWASAETEYAYGGNPSDIGAAGPAARAVWLMFRPDVRTIPWPIVVARNAAEALATQAAGPHRPWLLNVFKAGEEGLQAGFLHDIFGDSFYLLPALSPSLLAWHGGAAALLAQAIYGNRLLPSGHLDIDRLAVLADMLEEAGCTDADLLGHLRRPGLHVRGCWAVDLVLGKT
jgi:hypothetical protein